MNAVLSMPVPGSTFSPLAQAARELAAAKAAEQAANAARLEAEERVLLLVGELPPEGTTKHEAGDLVVKVQTSIRRTVDQAALEQVAHLIPEAIGKRVLRWKPELDTRELRYIQSNEPEIYANLSRAITAKPAKPTVSVESVKGEG